jgi:hypothetical protein
MMHSRRFSKLGAQRADPSEMRGAKCTGVKCVAAKYTAAFCSGVFCSDAKRIGLSTRPTVKIHHRDVAVPVQNALPSSPGF